MKRKPTTKQTVRTELISMFTRLVTEARETKYDHVREDSASKAVGAVLLALRADVIDTAAYNALCTLAGNARYERGIEMIYEQPPYTGSAFAKARRDASRAAA